MLRPIWRRWPRPISSAAKISPHEQNIACLRRPKQVVMRQIAQPLRGKKKRMWRHASQLPRSIASFPALIRPRPLMAAAA